jgi:sulfite reductase beta subunit-like hemoprotein
MNTPAPIRESDQALIKFHGMYMQDDRDRREERAEKKLERAYSYMIRLRLPRRPCLLLTNGSHYMK